MTQLSLELGLDELRTAMAIRDGTKALSILGERTLAMAPLCLAGAALTQGQLSEACCRQLKITA
jgi:hypothetical protein